jgi:aspartate kinase
VADNGPIGSATDAAAPEARPIVVMKFGGTSVATAEGRASLRARVRQALEAERAPVVVVSAMGRRGAPYATDTLLDLVTGCDDPHGRDLLASVGEVVSSVVVAHELTCDGITARAFTGGDAGIMTDAVPEAATITEIFPSALLTAIAEGVVPVVAGFQGVGPDGLLTTLGRGGSDTTACALGVALEAAEVEIYTDVDGVMTADPRTCDGAGVLERLGADELFQMARHGSRVVHTPAAELALASGLDMRVRNTFSAADGTLVVADIAGYRPDSVATAVSHAEGIARFEVPLPAAGGGASTAAQSQIYTAMADAGVSLDMFTPFGAALAFSVTEADRSRAQRVLQDLDLDFTSRSDLAKVTLVGAGMHGVPGVMARMAQALSSAGIGILQTADSHSTISVLVRDERCGDAVAALHEAFDLGG